MKTVTQTKAYVPITLRGFGSSGVSVDSHIPTQYGVLVFKYRSVILHHSIWRDMITH